jgi:RHS repeat-associated protein
VSYTWDVATNALKIIEENGYYPYGLKHSGYNGSLERHRAVANETKVELRGVPSGGSGATVEASLNQVRFNHREWQSELGLNVTDMDFRQYDNAIGRFVCTDPITHFNQSPYHFANNNPMYFADPSGLDGVVPKPTGTAYGMSGQSVAVNYGGPMGGHIGVWMGAQSEYEMSYEGHNGSQTFYGAEARSVFAQFALANGYTKYVWTYADSSSSDGIGLGIGLYKNLKGGNGFFGSLLNSMSSLFDWFGNNQSGYVFNDGSMKSDFNGSKKGSEGEIYAVTQNPWAPGATVHNFNPAPGIKASADLFATLLEIGSIGKDIRDTTKAETTRDSVTEQALLKTVNTFYYVRMKDGAHVLADNQKQLDSLINHPNSTREYYKGNNY